MFPCTVKNLHDICGVSIASGDVGSEVIRGVTIDSRSVQPGDVFFALPGSRTHGVQFTADALAAGAVCVVSDRPAAALSSNGQSSRILVVPDVQKALQEFAVWNRRQSSALTIGVTGSVGKTSTRQMIAAVLSSQFNGVQSPRNYNNELGLPLTLCELKPGHEFAVLELGAGKPGDISFLCGLAEPEMAVVSRVALCHLESFGSIDTIRRTKQELVEAIDASGTVFLNADDPHVQLMSHVAKGRVVSFGLSVLADVRADEIHTQDGQTQFTSDGHRFAFEGPRHLVTCALAAVAVGRTVGLSERQIELGLAQFSPDAGRGLVRLISPWTVIDETYNASPASVLATMESLRSWTGRRRILVLGDMLELGESAEALHCDLARALANSGIHHTLFCGKYSEVFASAALKSGLPLNRISAFHDQATLISMLDCVISPGDVICVKGSRSTHMEHIVDALLSKAAESLRAAA
ncbi:MAG: UDP-N-acetylmuramoyl-tripeptide--D-alanyl-D-alanine ligase [Planctomycetaceae bacterium]|nr:UDP-N-acetylmuramoyl-tripeptide--D-alanyl-D-alanine ligase [Planctomycetaceae bacterium]